MSDSEPDFAQTLLQAIRYEHWLRYHFAHPEDSDTTPEGYPPKAVLRIPEEVCETSRCDEPHLFPLLLTLRDRSVTLDDTRNVVLKQTASHLNTTVDDDGFGQTLITLLENPDFRREMDAFHAWVQDRAEHEEREIMLRSESEAGPRPVSFRDWEKQFRDWTRDNVRPYVTTISPLRK